MTLSLVDRQNYLLADEAQALLTREGQHLEQVRAWLQQIVTDWATTDVTATIAPLEASAKQLAEQRRRFKLALSKGLGVAPADGRLSLLMERLPVERRRVLTTARAHALWLMQRVAELMRLARMQSNDLSSCLNTLLHGVAAGNGGGGTGVVERYDGRGLKANSSRATFLNDRC